MADKKFMFFGLMFMVLMGCAIFIAWRLQRLAKQKEDAEKRAVVAFEQMNLLTKQLRERGTAAVQAEPIAPGERLQQMYPGPKRGQAGSAGS